ncbi:unnamed protein product [Danaus chrysippus]|uniref:(African queen) hypothetical protein n=1 Tax=Danaus chrysippus TaxID=151541 RepID=A0A8J2QZU7_9NEOP|nr:unnamed protein product [Danaus chrysippus]
MAPSVLRTSGYILLLFITNTLAALPSSIRVVNRECSSSECEYVIKVSGVSHWSLTDVPGVKNGLCTKYNHAYPAGVQVVKVPNAELFLCIENDQGWFYADVILDSDVSARTAENEIEDVPRDEVEKLDGSYLQDYYRDLRVNKNKDEVDELVETFEDSKHLRIKRQATEESADKDVIGEVNATEAAVLDAAAPTAAPYVGPIRLMGLRIEESAKEPKIVDGMIPSVLRETLFMMRLFGEGFTSDTVIAFTHVPEEYGKPCHFLLSGEYKIKEASSDSGLFELLAPPPLEDYKFYICTKNSSNADFVHQGQEKWKILGTHNKLLPLWASLILIVILLMLASLFSGLNLGLMALDRTELKIIANTGTDKERKYARAIMPVRAHGNYLLCTILLSNVAVNSTFTVILDDLTSGLVAVIGSTLAIVFIAEITPQAICARHGLLIGAKSIWIMKIVMGICAPLAWPTSKLLDYFLGEEIGTHYNRERLKELVKITNHVNDLDKEEVNIISGALDLRKKTVKDVMTKLKDCYMLPINSVLDFETMTEIVKSGYSRIPVYEGTRTNIVTVLFIKDLAFVDPDDNTPLRTLCQYYQNPCNFVFEDATLDVMLKQFKEGHKGHMAFVQRIEEGDGDPVYETVGLVTLEDVIEEMIQAEIVDESDVISDNRTKKRLLRPMNKLHDIAAFAGHQHQRVHVSPQLILATFQFLSTSVDPFRADMISENVLRRLLKQDVIQHVKLRGDEDKNDPKRYVFQEGKPVDYFVLILEGRVEVTVGRENLMFEAGPFTYFGVQALTQNVGVAESPAPSTLGSLQNLNMDSMLGHTFVPDYSVRAIAEVYYLTIKRSMYLAAKRATLMEKGALNKGGTNEQIEPEVDKLLREGDGHKLEEIVENEKENSLVKPFNPTSASPFTNSTFKSYDKENPEEEKLLKK